MEQTQLKPCPFCGSAAKMEVLGGKGSTHRTVQCAKCKCDLHWQATEELAIAAWNTRASDEQVRKLRKALGLVLDSVDYTSGACRLNEMVGATLPKDIIAKALEALEATND